MSRFYGDFDPASTADTVVVTEEGFTWNTSVNSSYYTFADNFTVQRSGSASWGYPAVSTAVFTEGKFSIDFRVNTVDSSTKRTNFGIVATSQVSIGGSNWLHKPFNDNAAHSAGVQDEGYSTGDIFTLNVNFDDKSLEVLQNNSSVGSDTFSTSGNFHIALQEYSNTSTFEVVAQVYTPPTGFTKITQTGGGPSSTTDTRSHSHVWNYSDVYDARFADTWPDLVYDTQIALYLPFNGSLTDFSSYGHTVSAVGNAAVTTSPFQFHGSCAFDGNGDLLTVPHNNIFDFVGNDFTIEGFINPTTAAGVQGVYAQWGGTGSRSFKVTISTAAKLEINGSKDGSTGGQISQVASTALELNTFSHFAVTREGSNFRIFINGVNRGTTTDSGNLYNSSANIAIGGNRADQTTNTLFGNLEDFRVVNGLALYTTAFEVPTRSVNNTLTVNP